MDELSNVFIHKQQQIKSLLPALKCHPQAQFQHQPPESTCFQFFLLLNDELSGSRPQQRIVFLQQPVALPR